MRDPNWFKKIPSSHHHFLKETFRKIKNLALPGVHFEENRLTDYLEGGTCSAVAFAFAKSYVNSQLVTEESKIQDALENYMKNSEFFRAEQLAFNTIEKSENATSTDFKFGKMQSIANYYDLIINHSSEDLEITTLKRDRESFEKKLKKLPNGPYIIRLIRSLKNYKEEYWGHTAFFLKDEIHEYLYDPNYGLKSLLLENTIEYLCSHFGLLEEIWGVDTLRFYRIEKNHSIYQVG